MNERFTSYIEQHLRNYTASEFLEILKARLDDLENCCLPSSLREANVKNHIDIKRIKELITYLESRIGANNE